MNAKEAINQIKDNLGDLLVKNVGLEGLLYVKLQTALYLAINALEKQVEKPPIFHKETKEDKDLYIKREIYSCPECKNSLYIQNHKEKRDIYGSIMELDRYPQGSRPAHCPYCGQAIHW